MKRDTHVHVCIRGLVYVCVCEVCMAFSGLPRLVKEYMFNNIMALGFNVSMLMMMMMILMSSPAYASTSTVCNPVKTTSNNWVYNVSIGTAPSCKSSNGGTNDLGTRPQMCENDPTSIRLQTTSGKAECLVAKAFDCKISMHDFISLDYDFAIENCLGVWAAPLWLTPDTWQWGPGSGEIDSLEFCTRDAIHLNYAGGGHQVRVNNATFSIDNSNGHVTVRKDAAGIVTTSICTSQEAKSNVDGQCKRPIYTDCNDCMQGNQSFSCWCNPNTNPQNIYGSGGCSNGGDCLWTLVSDIWNGVAGDGGYDACMTGIPGVVEQGKPNLNGGCKISVEKVTIKGGGSNGSLRWGKGSDINKCKILTPSP